MVNTNNVIGAIGSLAVIGISAGIATKMVKSIKIPKSNHSFKLKGGKTWKIV